MGDGDRDDTPPSVPGVYERAVHRADPDSLHDVIARAGPAILTRGLPFVVIAARWRASTRANREARRAEIRHEASAELVPPPVADPYQLLEHYETYRILADGLASLSDADIACIWGPLEGQSDVEVAEQIARMEGGVPLKEPAIRKRRERALKRLRAYVQSKLPGDGSEGASEKGRR